MIILAPTALFWFMLAAGAIFLLCCYWADTRRRKRETADLLKRIAAREARTPEQIERDRDREYDRRSWKDDWKAGRL